MTLELLNEINIEIAAQSLVGGFVLEEDYIRLVAAICLPERGMDSKKLGKIVWTTI
jgi:hypothetical protein